MPSTPPTGTLPHPSITAVVPTLDEEPQLRRHLPEVLRQVEEVVVSDGGSRDASRRVARDLGARVVQGAAGRGGQLNLGARAATGDVLLFLHADTALPPGAAEALREAVERGAAGGAFLVRFEGEDRRRLLRIGGWLVNLRTRWLEVPLGDQGQFATREAFEAVGGFPDWPILEDIHFIRRLRRRGPLSVLPLRVTTSGRRFVQRGVVRTVATNWLIWALYLLGVSPHRLAGLYRHIR